MYTAPPSVAFILEGQHMVQGDRVIPAYWQPEVMWHSPDQYVGVLAWPLALVKSP